MTKFKDVYEKVKGILETNPQARDSDAILIDNFYISYWSLALVLTKIRKGDWPSFESVTRARRKVQEQHPHLKGTERSRRCREKKEEEMKKDLTLV